MFSKTKMNVNWHFHFFSKMPPQHHWPSSTCHFNLCHVDFSSHTILHAKSKLWVSIDMHFFGCRSLHVKCQKRAKLCQYTYFLHFTQVAMAGSRSSSLVHAFPYTYIFLFRSKFPVPRAGTQCTYTYLWETHERDSDHGFLPVGCLQTSE